MTNTPDHLNIGLKNRAKVRERRDLTPRLLLQDHELAQKIVEEGLKVERPQRRRTTIKKIDQETQKKRKSPQNLLKGRTKNPLEKCLKYLHLIK